MRFICIPAEKKSRLRQLEAQLMVHRRVRGGKYKVKKSPSPSPVEVGDELEVNIIDKSPSGDGISEIRGYTIVVPKAKPGERVTVRITSVGKKTATGEKIQ